jgi:DMSO/TMAO reductase YedYZ molybdopterin-dependent catalytic subunit
MTFPKIRSEQIMRRWPYGALAGLLAGLAGVAAGQLAAAITRPQSSPIITVGETMIDATPTPLKEFAIRQFGSNDKHVLLSGIGVMLAVFAIVVGIIAVRKLWIGLVGVGLFGVIGIAAAISRPTFQFTDLAPAIIAGAVSVAVLWLLLKDQHQTSAGTDHPSAFTRRSFLRTGGLVAIGAVLVGAGGDLLTNVKQGSIAKLRTALRLPAPADAGPPAVTAAGFYTPDDAFYRVDTALTIPEIDPGSWTLKIHGMVDHPMTLNLDQLLARPLIQRDITLNCVSNEVGGPYVGTARWLGAPLAALLTEAGVKPGADQVVARSIDGMTIGTPVATIMDGRPAMLAVGMNGQPLPFEHGFPVRMLTPGLYGYVGACKWIIDIEVTTFAAYDPYWVKRGWTAMAPVKTASRIDRPAGLSQLKAGQVRVQGVAWAQERGIAKVEVQVDSGAWHPATLAPVPSIDTWVQWTWPWRATAGLHQLTVRATDKTGAVQPEKRVDTFPNGATGWHSVSVTVS